MDDPALDAQTYEAVLADLARVNRVTLAQRPMLDFLARATRGMPRFTLLDVGFGQGDMLRAIARWVRKSGKEARLIGIDLNPRSLTAARAQGGPIDYRTGDYREVSEPVHFVISSLVAHHMTDAQRLDFLRFMDVKARRGWLVNDLHRHRFAYAGYPVLARLLRAHPIVRHDGRLSIARSFRPADWQAMLQKAEIDGARIRRFFPFRLCVEKIH